MLSPLSFALSIALDGSGGSEASTFMSGSGSPLGTINGSSPGCQRSIVPSAPPIEELPKNRPAVFTEKPSCTGGPSVGTSFTASSGRASDGDATSYCASGGALSASASSGSSGAWSVSGRLTVFAPITDELDVDGSSFDGAALAGGKVSGGATTRRSPLSARSTFGKSEG